mmetsp:Transcript_18264/g.30013  ORF Transcript_18264/g.30013 Transcript_18264/m.30013 type:complete len:522 (+) Transcript_18264:141-1706(+)
MFENATVVSVATENAAKIGDSGQIPGKKSDDGYDTLPGTKYIGITAIRKPVLLWLKQRLTVAEVSGSLGDLGTFIPIVLAMCKKNGMNFGSALLFAGIFNVITGIFWEIPMAVQPMKAIAAVALKENLTVPQIVSAGMGVSALVLFLGLTRLIDVINRIIPVAVIKGLQLGLGLNFIIQGMGYVSGTGVWVGGVAGDCMLMGVLAAIFVVVFEFDRRVPRALVLFAIGLVVAITGKATGSGDGTPLTFGIRIPIVVPTTHDFLTGFVKASIPQFPLTTLNSVISVCALSRDLFPRTPAVPWHVCVAVGCMNLFGAWFGTVPYCHGAGGLAGQYKMGARSNVSILFLGSAKIIIAVVFGSSLLSLLSLFPNSILGVMLAISGTELAINMRDQTAMRSSMLVVVTAAGVILYQTAIGFAIGIACAIVAAISQRFNDDRNGRTLSDTALSLLYGPSSLQSILGLYKAVQTNVSILTTTTAHIVEPSNGADFDSDVALLARATSATTDPLPHPPNNNDRVPVSCC